MEKLKGMEVSVSRSAQVGLQFPVGCIHRALRRDSGSFLEHQVGEPAFLFRRAVPKRLHFSAPRSGLGISCGRDIRTSENAARDNEKTSILGNPVRHP